MEASPLTRQTRPDSFQPKIVQLYKDLFDVRCPVHIVDCTSPTCRVESHIYQVRDHVQLSEGFWLEFFLLPPEKVLLQQELDTLTADDVLQIQVRLGNPLSLVASVSCSSTLLQERTQLFFARASDEVLHGPEPRNQNALEVGPALLRQIHGLTMLDRI
jgi:hypothetical protein